MESPAERPRPFKVRISDAAVKDLKSRVANTRWPRDTPESDWQYGVNAPYIKGLAEHWKRSFSWRKVEKEINDLPQFTLPVNGIDLHFVHSRSSQPNAIPLLVIHGWPSCFLEVKKILPMLTGNQVQRFHVVAPSLPGFGFSSAPDGDGFGLREMAKTLDSLMRQLGYTTYVAHGTDWGAILLRILAANHSDSCKAVHGPPMAAPSVTNLKHVAQLINCTVPGLSKRPLFLSPSELKGLQTTLRYVLRGSGYFLQQATFPETLAYSLTDSPIGLLAWIVDKFYRWTDCKGDLDSVISKDDLLTIVSIYWFNNNIASSMRIYYEFVHTDGAVEVLRLKGRACLPVKQWSVFPKGGHFPALEQPGDLVDDMVKFFSAWH